MSLRENQTVRYDFFEEIIETFSIVVGKLISLLERNEKLDKPVN